MHPGLEPGRAPSVVVRMKLPVRLERDLRLFFAPGHHHLTASSYHCCCLDALAFIWEAVEDSDLEWSRSEELEDERAASPNGIFLDTYRLAASWSSVRRCAASLSYRPGHLIVIHMNHIGMHAADLAHPWRSVH